MSSWLQRLTSNRNTMQRIKDELERVRENLVNFEPIADKNRADVQETLSMFDMMMQFYYSTLESMEKIRKK